MAAGAPTGEAGPPAADGHGSGLPVADGRDTGRPAPDRGDGGLPAVIICGLGTVGGRVAELLAADHAVTILSRGHDERVGAVTSLANVRLLEGDFLSREALRRAGLPGAAALLAVSADDFANFAAALLARELDPAVPLLVRLADPRQAAALGRHLPGALGLSVPALAAPMFGVAAYRAGHHAGRLELLEGEAFLVGDHPWLAAELRVPGGADARQTVAELERRGGLVVLSRRCAEGAGERGPPELLPPSELALAPGDELLVAGPWERMVGAEPERGIGGVGRAWAAAYARGRALAGSVRPVVWGVLGAIAAAVVLNTVLFALVYHLTPLDALYFVVATITTVGYGDISLRDAPPGLKAYGVLFMLYGVVLIASLYAVITDYLVGSRLNELLGARPLPRRGHVIVCGLGTVGRRAARMLRSIGQPVVGVDRAGGPVERARDRGIPVVVGDAAAVETLHEAGVAGARCVVAATSDDHANLAIALAAREASPDVAIVLRLFDRALIGPVRSALGIDETLSASEPAAHAFALAARLGPAYRAVLDGGAGAALHVVEVTLPAEAPAGEAIESWLAERAGGRLRLLTESAVGPEPHSEGRAPPDAAGRVTGRAGAAVGIPAHRPTHHPASGAGAASSQTVALVATPEAARRLTAPAPPPAAPEPTEPPPPAVAPPAPASHA